MESSFLINLFSKLHVISPLWILGLKIFLTNFSVLLIFKWFQLPGLYVYGSIGIIAANIAVLKQVTFPFYPTPLALGTVFFTSLYLVNSLINEYYGKKSALMSINLGFLGYFILTLFMMMVLSFPIDFSSPIDSALKSIFLPAPAIFLASLIAYFVSQYTDVILYRYLYNKTHSRFLALRVLITSLISTLLDTTIFSILAWKVFSATPYSLTDIFWIYIGGSTCLRVLLSFSNAGFMSLSKFFKPSSLNSSVTPLK